MCDLSTCFPKRSPSQSRGLQGDGRLQQPQKKGTAAKFLTKGLAGLERSSDEWEDDKDSHEVLVLGCGAVEHDGILIGSWLQSYGPQNPILYIQAPILHPCSSPYTSPYRRLQKEPLKEPYSVY